SLHLCAIFNLHTFHFRTLLRKHRSNTQSAELQLSFKPEQTLCAFNERSSERKGYVSGFNVFDNIIFFALILKFNLVFEIERSLSIVVEVQFQLIANFAHYVHINIHIEIETSLSALTLRKNGIIYFLIIASKSEV